MRCPNCNRKWKKVDLFKLNFCKKCGRKFEIGDFLTEETIERLKKNEEK